VFYIIYMARQYISAVGEIQTAVFSFAAIYDSDGFSIIS